MNSKPILIVPGEPKSIFFEILFKSLKLNKIKSPLIIICNKKILYKEIKKFNFREKIEDFDKKFQDIINTININAPVKIIYKNKNDGEIVSIFNEIMHEIQKIELQEKIESLEDKVSLNLNENLYSELLSLRNQLKKG